MIDPVSAAATHQLVLFEGTDQYGRLRPTLADGTLMWDEPITENPMINGVEIWEIYNATADAHPIDLHVVAFQVLGREDFTGTVTTDPVPDAMGGTKQYLSIDTMSGIVDPPAPNEAGLKDTITMLPGQVTRIIAIFDREGRYVWHCQILSHEDHEMMRPFEVLPEQSTGHPSIDLEGRRTASTPTVLRTGRNSSSARP